MRSVRSDAAVCLAVDRCRVVDPVKAGRGEMGAGRVSRAELAAGVVAEARVAQGPDMGLGVL